MKGECGKCGSGTVQGVCPACVVGSWSPEQRADVNRLICSARGRAEGWGDEPDDSERMSRALRHENTRREYIALGSAWHHRRITRTS